MVAILRYHAIADPDHCWYAGSGLCVSPSAFARHAQYLCRRYRVLDLTEVANRLRDGKPLPRPSIVFTFDDGYADNLEAARILRRYGVRGTFFVTAGCLGGERPFWPSEIRYHLARMRDSRVRLGSGSRTLELRTGGGLAAGTEATLARWVKSLSVPERDEVLEQLRFHSRAGCAPSPLLTWAELAELRDLGMAIGAHTLSHANLPSAGDAQASREIAGSRARLEAELGSAVTTFAYPNGGAEVYYTTRVQEAVAQAGFVCAVTSRNGFVTPASHRFALERIRVAERLQDVLFALEVERFAFKPRA